MTYTEKRLEKAMIRIKKQLHLHWGDTLVCVDPTELETAIKQTFTTSIHQAEQARDEYWKEQEMGKSSDCSRHCEEAIAEDRERVRGMKKEIPPYPSITRDELLIRTAYNQALDDILSSLDKPLTDKDI